MLSKERAVIEKTQREWRDVGLETWKGGGEEGYGMKDQNQIQNQKTLIQFYSIQYFIAILIDIT